MTPLEKLAIAAPTMKVFPLPSSVLLPGGAVPLHIFEPRYRALVKRALETDGVMALADLAPGWEENYGGKPSMRPIACAGLIVWDQQLAEGRYNIILSGISRIRIQEELPGEHLYREIRAELISDPHYEGPEEVFLREALLELSGRMDPEIAEQLLQMGSRSKGGLLADMVANAVLESPERRRAALEELDPARRLNMMVGEIGELIARVGAARTNQLMN